MPIVADLMTHHADRIGLSATLGEAAAVMVRSRISSVIIVEGVEVLGIVTERDILHAMRLHQDPSLPVADIMSSPVQTVSADKEFREAYRDAARKGIRHLVVVDADKSIVGVVTETDFRRHLGLDFFRQLTNVDSLMDRDFPRLEAGATLDEAVAAMENARATSVVVVDGATPVGIVTERDVVRLFVENDSAKTLHEVMTHPVATVTVDTSLADAAQTMLDHHFRHLAVLDQTGHLVGLLTEHSLMRPLELDLVDAALADRIELSIANAASEKHLSRNERYQRALLDNFPFLVWLKDTESRYLAVNKPFAEAAGLASSDAMSGMTDLDVWPQDLAEHYRADDLAVMATGQKKYVLEEIAARGGRLWHETYKAPVIDAEGRTLGTVGFARDITVRRRTEEAIIIRNAALAGLLRGERLESLLELIALSAETELPDFVCSILLVSDDGRHLRLGAAPSLPESSQAALDGIDIAEGVGTSGTAAFRRSRVVIEDVYKDPKGKFFHDFAAAAGITSGWSEPIFAPDGELLGTFAAYHTKVRAPNENQYELLRQASQLAALVISHYRSADRLQASLTTFRGIFDSVDEALLLLDQTGSFVDVNPRAEQLSGYSRSELVGSTYHDLMAEGLNDPGQIDAFIAGALLGEPQVFEFWVLSKTGRIFPVEVRFRPGKYFGRDVIIVSAQDICERKAAAQRLEVERDLAEALAGGRSREALYPLLLDISLRFPEFECGGLYLREQDGGYRLLEHRGLSDQFVDAVSHFPSSSSQAEFLAQGEVVCSCQEMGSCCNNFSLIHEDLLQREGVRCVTVLPVVVNSLVVACISLGSRNATQVSHGTYLALLSLGQHFSQTLLRLEAQEETLCLQQNLSGLFDALRDFLFVIDPQGLILHCNHAVTELLGYAPGALVGQPFSVVHPPAMREMVNKLVAEMVTGQRSSSPLPILRHDGKQVMVETRVAPGYWNGKPVLLGVSQDISERLLAEERQKLAASVFDNAHEGIMVTDPQGRIVEINSTFSELTGYTRQEAVGQTADLLKSGHHAPEFYLNMWQTIRAEGYWRGEVWNRKKNGEIFVELLTISTVRDRQGEISHFVGIFSDITLLKEHQQRLEHLAHFDPLTQLPNRMLLGDRMQLAMAQTGRNGKTLGVCYLDLDGFKPVNDLYGHATGDRLLVEVAQRLKACVRGGDTVSRLGGDEFVMLLSGLENVHECDLAVGRVIHMLTQPFLIGGHSIAISASIGVTLFPHDGSDADTLLRHADQAMYEAKQAGRNRHHLFDPENDRRARQRREEVGEVRRGLSKGEFELYYQPKVNMREGDVLGAEALIRWHHPERGLLLPGQFLHIIENSELSIELGDWVISESLRQLDEWVGQGLDISVSINIAGNHLQHPKFARHLGEFLAAHPRVPASRLELEVLETAALEDIALVADLFAECRQLGVSFALDDFGTGYSSLTYFRRLPADMLKIDQSFVRDMLDDPEDMAIVEGVIGLTKAFKRQVIAEGVETVEHGLVLLILGCDLAQGYGIARPMPASELPDWIRQFRPHDLWSSATAFNWSREDIPLLIAEAEHNRWIKALNAYLDAPIGLESAPETDHRKCRFGHWYHSEKSQRYTVSEGFLAIDPIHRHLHEVGLDLIALHLAGDDLAVSQRRPELDRASAALTECIQLVQAEMLISTQISKR